MEFHTLSTEARYYLQVMEVLVSSDYEVNLIHHGKAIRDIMDNLEGHLHGCLNKNNRYSHSTLKHEAPYMSAAAFALRDKLTQSQFLKATYREHAKPFKIVITEIEGLKGQQLLDYVLQNIKSVTILNEEQQLLDKTFKDKMPDPRDIFSRYKAVGIKIIKRK